MRPRSENPVSIAKREGISRQAVYKSMEPPKCPEFDCDGYPTEATLETIATWPLKDDWSLKQFYDYCAKAWRYGWPVKKGGTGRDAWIKIATGGWSGNEDIVLAMQRNYMFWALCWLESTRGGGHKFKSRPFGE